MSVGLGAVLPIFFVMLRALSSRQLCSFRSEHFASLPLALAGALVLDRPAGALGNS